MKRVLLPICVPTHDVFERRWVNMVRHHIETEFGAKYLPAKAEPMVTKRVHKETHEAIRPSNVALKATTVGVERDAQRLYDLIWRQFVACQMTPAEYFCHRLF